MQAIAAVVEDEGVVIAGRDVVPEIGDARPRVVADDELLDRGDDEPLPGGGGEIVGDLRLVTGRGRIEVQLVSKSGRVRSDHGPGSRIDVADAGLIGHEVDGVRLHDRRLGEARRGRGGCRIGGRRDHTAFDRRERQGEQLQTGPRLVRCFVLILGVQRRRLLRHIDVQTAGQERKRMVLARRFPGVPIGSDESDAERVVGRDGERRPRDLIGRPRRLLEILRPDDCETPADQFDLVGVLDSGGLKVALGHRDRLGRELSGVHHDRGAFGRVLREGVRTEDRSRGQVISGGSDPHNEDIFNDARFASPRWLKLFLRAIEFEHQLVFVDDDPVRRQRVDLDIELTVGQRGQRAVRVAGVGIDKDVGWIDHDLRVDVGTERRERKRRAGRRPEHRIGRQNGFRADRKNRTLGRKRRCLSDFRAQEHVRGGVVRKGL